MHCPTQVYKKLGQTHLALMNFSWAMDLDPKGANNQIKEAIDKRYLPDDEEPVTEDYPYDSGTLQPYAFVLVVGSLGFYACVVLVTFNL